MRAVARILSASTSRTPQRYVAGVLESSQVSRKRPVGRLSSLSSPSIRFRARIRSALLHSCRDQASLPAKTAAATARKMSTSRIRHNRFFSEVAKSDPLLPSMIVFDLDDCLWTPEMHELPGMPEIPVHGDLRRKGDDDWKGVLGLQVPGYRTTVRLHEEALAVLQELALDPKYEGIVLATASTSLEPSYSYACLEHLEVLPGLALADMFSWNQVGRTGHLSSDKLTHFRHLHSETRIPFEEMLFFDDCNWGDHCGRVTQHLGVVSRRTPHGLELRHFHEALRDYERHARERTSKEDNP